MALMHFLNDLQTTKLKMLSSKTYGWEATKIFVSLLKQWRKQEIDFRYQRTKSQIKGQQFQIKLQIPQPKAVSDISNFPKSTKTVDLKTIQTCSRGETKTELMDPNNFRQDKS